MKSSTIILLGIIGVVLIGILIKQHYDFADLEKRAAIEKRGRDMSLKKVATRENENKDLREILDIMRDMIRQKNKKAQGSGANKEDPLGTWLGNFNKLKDFDELYPQYSTSEFKYLTVKDWLAVTQDGQFKTEADYRKALGELRARGMARASEVLLEAIAAFSRANNGDSPQNLADITRYLPEDFDTSRFTDNPSGTAQYRGDFLDEDQRWLIKGAGPVDAVWDNEVWISDKKIVILPINPYADVVVHAAIKKYEKENGRQPKNSDQIIKYISPGMKASAVKEAFESVMTPIH